jgi:hypothetical protein
VCTRHSTSCRSSRFQVLEAGSASKVELVELTTLEPMHDEGSSNISTPPIIDLVTPKLPEPEQLVLALSVLIRALGPNVVLLCSS